MTTVDELAEAGEDELVRLLGKAHGVALYRMALGHDDRPVVAERDAKSVSVEDTFDVDLHDRVRVRTEVERLADRCVQRLRGAERSGRTVVLKVRRYDFSTLTRSETLRGPTDDPAVVREAAARLLESVDTTGGVRLLGVGVTGLADYTQEDLFAQAAGERAAPDDPAAEDLGPGEHGDEPAAGAPEQETPEPLAARRWPAGHDVRHDDVRARVGAGQRGRAGDGAVRGARVAARAGAHVPDRRSGAGARGSAAAGARTAGWTGYVRPGRPACRSRGPGRPRRPSGGESRP